MVEFPNTMVDPPNTMVDLAEFLYFIHNNPVLLTSDLGRYPVSLLVKGGFKRTQLI